MFSPATSPPGRPGRCRSRLKYNLAAPLLSALLLYLSFNWERGRLLAVLALVPLLAAADRLSRTGAFLTGLTAGGVFYFVELYWIGRAIANYTSLPGFLVNPILLLLALYLGLYFAFFTLLWQFSRTATSREPSLIAPTLAAAGWVLLEDLRSRLLGGFPWHPLGLALAGMSGVKELFAFGGVRLASALVVMSNTGFYLAGKNFHQKRPCQAAGAALLLSPLLAAALFMPGHRQLPKNAGGGYGKPLRVLIIQPNIRQSDKWQREKRPAIIRKMLSLSRQKATAAVDLVVWPEASLPLFLQKNRQVLHRLSSFCRHYHLYLMVGGPGYTRPTRRQDAAIYNSAFLLSPDGQVQVYNKIRLVPFGEATPLATIFPQLGKVVPGPDYTPGKGIKNFSLAGRKFAPSICFEGVFPVFTARFFAAGAGFLVNQTNDAWFGNSPGPVQHLENLRLRALENRCYIVRAANTGISAIIDPRGRIVKRLELHQDGTIEAVIYPRMEPTFYARHPRLPTITALALLCLGLVLLCWRHFATPPPEQK